LFGGYLAGMENRDRGRTQKDDGTEVGTLSPKEAARAEKEHAERLAEEARRAADAEPQDRYNAHLDGPLDGDRPNG
jgi:hypothetical protein